MEEHNMNTRRITGMDAIEYARENDQMLSKYADPIEDARDGLTITEAEEIAREDANLIYIDVEQRYYLIRRERVVNSNGADTEYYVQTEPGRTNLGDKPVLEGWLGQTNDWSEYALGEFASLEDALAEIPEGFVEAEIDEWDREDGIVAHYRDSREVWDVGDWLADYQPTEEHQAMSVEEVAKEFEEAAEHDGIILRGNLRARLSSILGRE
jgi:hypothetical protein